MHRVTLNHHILDPKNDTIIIDDVDDFNINSNASDVDGGDDVLDVDDNNKGMAVMIMLNN